MATSSGTTALHLALAALGIGPGDNVIVPDLTFVASANTVSYTGAKVKLVDADPEYWCADPEKIEAAIDKDTKAIMPVHLYGHPCDMGKIMRIARKHGLYVIEDCAESLGAEYQGRKAGSFGDISCFSFFGNKIITTGEGGMCLTNNKILAERMRILRDHGMSKTRQYWFDVIGYNYRMTNMQAAVGVAQLAKVGRFLAKRRHIAKVYHDCLKDILVEGSPKKGEVVFEPEMDWATNAYWMQSVLVKNRDRARESLTAAGIETRPFFPAIHRLPPYRRASDCRVSETLSDSGMNLPSSTTLTDAEIGYVAAKLKALISK